MAYNVHDLTFKRLLASHTIFKEFCEKHLPVAVNKRIDWQTAKLLKINNESTNVKRKRKAKSRLRDITYLVGYDGSHSDSLIICVEHQSSPDELMSLRCVNYMTNQMLDYLENNKGEKSPSIINLVFYHGERVPWPYSMDVFDLFSDPTLMKDYFLSPVLVDISQISDDEFKNENLLEPMEYLFKHVNQGEFKDEKILNLASLLHAALNNKKYTDQSEVDEIVGIMLNYGLERCECEPEKYINTLVERLSEYREMIMRGGQILRKQGYDEGLSKGLSKGLIQGVSQGKDVARKEIAINMLVSGIAPEIVAKHCDLSILEINKLLHEVSEKNPH